MTDLNNSHNNQTTFYNIDIYNDNSTGSDISSLFTTSFQSPLLINPSHHEITVARARIPCDQIPLSQDNLPFEQWEIEIGVPVIGTPNTYTYYNSYVPQFNPQPAQSYVVNTAIIGLLGNYLDVLTIRIPDPPATPTGTLPLTLTPYPNPILLQGVIDPISRLTTIAYGLTSIYRVTTSTQIDVFSYGSSVTLTINLYAGSIIRAICATKLNDFLYVVISNPDGSGMELLFYQSPLDPRPASISLSTPANTIINSFSVNTTNISLSFLIDGLTQIINYRINQLNQIFVLVNQPAISPPNTIIYTYVDDSGNYYQADFFLTDRSPRPNTFQRFDITNPQTPALQTYLHGLPNSFRRFLGLDLWGNILVCCLSDFIGNPFSIQSFNVINGGNQVYRIYSPIEPMSISVFGSQTINIPAQPSLTPDYPVMTINEYLDQINLAFASIMAKIPTPLSSPNETPTLTYDSTLQIININTDPTCISSLTTSCVINFNKLLWSFFKFTSSPAVSQNLGTGARTLTITEIIQPQPNSTLYRFADLTRIIIATNRMGVKGDNSGFNTLLVNIGDFTVDTSYGIPELVIYNPVVLRFYQLYQTNPLLNIDIFISYANRAGKVFPITISPYNSIGLKLQFRNSNDPNKSYNDS